MKPLHIFWATLLAFIIQQSAFAAETAGSSQNVLQKPAQTGAAILTQSDINKPVRDKWALLVGISNFQDAKIPHLKYGTKDARDFYSYLTQEGNFAPDHVRILLDTQATQRRIMSELGSKFLARLAKPDDLIVVFFSTHGSPSQMDLRGKNYIVAYDSDPQDLFATGIEMQKILDAIQGRVLSDRVVLIMDACHSGSAGSAGKGMFRSANFDAEALAEGSGQMVICSSKPDEQSWESRRYQNGVFTKNLLDELRTSGLSTPLSKAFADASQLVQDEVQEDRPGARQTPILSSKWQGSSLIIAVKPTAPQKIPATVKSELGPDSSPNINTPIAADSSSKSIGTPNSNNSEADVQDRPASDQIQKSASIVLTASYFSQEKNPRTAYSEACSQQDAHFNDPWFYFRKAKILIQLGNFSKAEQELKGLIVDDPNNSDYYLARAYCYHMMGKQTAAEDELGRARFKNPTLPDKIEFGD